MLRYRLTFPCILVSWLIGVSSCWLLALLPRFPLLRLRLLLPRPVLVVLPSLCRGFALEPVFSHVFGFFRQWFDVADLEGLLGVSGALAAASVYMFHDLSKPAAAAASASAFEVTEVPVGDLTVPFVSESWLAAGMLNYVVVFDGVCALVETFWCLDGDIAIYCSSSSSTAAVCICSLCAFVGISLFLEGVQCFLDGAIIAAGLAHVLVGVYWTCGCNSSGTGMVPHSSCSAFACDFPLFDGVNEFACVLSILKLGGLWFLAGPFSKSKRICLSWELSKFISSGIRSCDC